MSVTLLRNLENRTSDTTCKYKVKVPRNRPEGPEGARGIALLSRDFGVGRGVCGQHHGPAALPPGKTRYPLYRRLGGPQERSGRV
jgi:hypothetical protein